jgi:uncharacterized protein
MHMAPRAAAWVAWAVWICNNSQDAGRERADFGPLFFLPSLIGGFDGRYARYASVRAPAPIRTSSMKLNCLFLAFCFWSGGAAFANDAPPSDESLRQLFALAHTEETMNSMKPQLDAIISSSMKEVSQGKEITPERQAIIDRMREKLVAAYNGTFSFEPLHLLLIRAYQATYTQDEIDGLIAFYKTPAGQALVNKGPLMAQNLMSEMQAAMRPLMQQIGQIRREADQEMLGAKK